MDARIGATNTSSGSGWRHSALLRTMLSSGFMLLMLASAHLLMVVVNYAEHRIERPSPAAGSPARMFTDLTLPEEFEAALKKTTNPDEQRVLAAALAEARAGRDVPMRTLPVTPFLAQATLALVALGGLLMWATSRLKSDAAQSILGIFAGNLIWTGGIEYGLTMAARTLGVAKSVTVMDGQLVAIYGEYVLLKYTWGALVLVMAYLMFLEASRCPLALWWRRHVPTMRGAIATGKIDNYGPRSAFQYATTVWGFYLILLWAYDESFLGVHSVFTNALLFASLAGSLYCVWRLYQFKGWGPAIRFCGGGDDRRLDADRDPRQVGGVPRAVDPAAVVVVPDLLWRAGGGDGLAVAGAASQAGAGGRADAGDRRGADAVARGTGATRPPSVAREPGPDPDHQGVRRWTARRSGVRFPPHVIPHRW
jgi:hypothetical protein